MAGSNDDVPPPPPPQTQTPTQQAPHTVSTIKLPLLKKGEYDIWAMKMEHYLAHTDYPIWEVIQKGNGPVSVSIDTNGLIKVLPPKTAKEILARERERKARTTLLMTIPEDHLAKFHKMTDAKEIWEAIKSRFGGNDESKKMQKYILKQQFEGFSISNSEGCIKAMTDSRNVAFVSENTNSINEVNTAYGASSSSSQNPQRESSSSYIDEVIYSFFATQSSGPQLVHEYLEQLDEFDLEEMDLKWQVAMISMRIKKFYKKTGRKLHFNAKEPVGFNKYKAKDNRRRPGKQEEPKALVTLDGDGVDWTSHLKDEQDNYALMAYNNSGLDTEEKIRFMKIDLDDKTDVLTYHKKLLAEAEKENKELKTKVEKWHNSSKSLNILLNSQMSAMDKVGLVYGNQMHNGVLSYENEVFGSLFDNRSSDKEGSPVNDMQKEYMLLYESDTDDEHVSLPTTEQETPSFAFVNNDKHVKTPRFTTKACFKGKGNVQRENKPVWNNVQRVNHKNQIIPTAVLTRTGIIPVNTSRASGTNNVSTARHNFNSQIVLTNAARKVNTVKPIVNDVNTAKDRAVSAVGGIGKTAVKPSDDPHKALKNKEIVNSGCSRHMTGNKAYLVDYQDYNGGPVAFGGSKGFITCKGKIRTGKLAFEDNKVLFTDTECLVLSPDFKLPNENQVLLRVLRQNNMYSFNLENIVPSGGLACLIVKSIVDESNQWHRRLGHGNFKILNKIVKGNLVRGLPSKIFQNDHTCVACQKGKQHKASCKAKSLSSISQSLQLLHMDLFGPTSARIINYKTYCLVITDDFSRFSWVFFLRTKDEISGILKDFIRQIENQLNKKVKPIRCDNGTEFKNKDMIEFYGSKGIKREYSNVKTPQ
ncbi:putative ribonuclease H-like domain-containing protein [Tanacetum coccineum]